MSMCEFHFGLLGGALLVFLSTLGVWAAGAVIAWLKKSLAVTGTALWARRLAGLMSLLNLAFVFGLIAAIYGLKPGAFAGGPPPVVMAIFVLPLLAAALAVVVSLLAFAAWKNRYWSLAGRLHYSLVAVAGLAFAWSLHYWDLLGFSL